MSQQVESLLAAIHEGIQADGEYGPHEATCLRAKEALQTLKERLEMQEKVIDTLQAWLKEVGGPRGRMHEQEVLNRVLDVTRGKLAEQRLAAWDYGSTHAQQNG